ncbi:hypothetical protein D3C72_1534220 [compost metagenome]
MCDSARFGIAACAERGPQQPRPVPDQIRRTRQPHAGCQPRVLRQQGGQARERQHHPEDGAGGETQYHKARRLVLSFQRQLAQDEEIGARTGKYGQVDACNGEQRNKVGHGAREKQGEGDGRLPMIVVLNRGRADAGFAAL